MLTQHISELEMQNEQCAESIRILEQQKNELENLVSNYQNETKVFEDTQKLFKPKPKDKPKRKTEDVIYRPGDEEYDPHNDDYNT